MKIAIMQPYIFPYIGYFQLINAVDKFAIYDDVNYIKQGWINRNRLLVNGLSYTFTIPIENNSSFTTIQKTKIDQKNYEKWKGKFYKTLELSYKKAPYFEDIIKLVFLTFDSQFEFISELALKSILNICSYLKIDTTFVKTSSLYNNANLHSQNRIIDICKKEHATEYINLIGGIELYSKKDFAVDEITLKFLKPKQITYNQNNFNAIFHENLSIIDVLMFNSIDETKKILNEKEFV